MKKKLLIDMDDVLVKDYLINAINYYTNENYVLEDFKNYYMQDILKNKEDFFKFYLSENTYRFTNIENIVITSLQKLNERYDVYILSAYIFKEDVKNSGINLKSKHDFLVEKFPFLDANRFIFTSAKNLVHGDIKIDDKLSNLENADIKLLYTAYHNKNISLEELKNKGVIRVNNFDDILKVLE